MIDSIKFEDQTMDTGATGLQRQTQDTKETETETKRENTTIITEETKTESITPKKRFVLPELPYLEKRGKKIVLSFPLEKQYITETVLEQGKKDQTKVFHLYPKISNWPARQAPDAPNPRSHNKECLRSPVAKAIEQTLREHPKDFLFANRGLAIMVNSLNYDPQKEQVELTLTHPENHGVADGATTDAVIAKIQHEIAESIKTEEENKKEIYNPLESGRVHLEVITGLTDHDRIAWLVEGRNTSRQVKGWSMSDFRGQFDWLREILETEDSPFRGKIGWEENSGKSWNVLDVISIATLFHRFWDEGEDEEAKAPIIAYASKGKLDTKLTSEEMQNGYQSLATILHDLLQLHDYVYTSFEEKYNMAFKGKAKLGKRAGFRSKLLKDKKHRLYLTGMESNYVIDNGILYPILASLRVLVRYGRDSLAAWKRNPFKFFEEHGHKLIRHLIDQLEANNHSPNKLGKSKTAYIALEREAKLLLTKNQE